MRCSAFLVLVKPKRSEVLLVVVPRVLEQPELRLAHRLPRDPLGRNNAGQEERIVENAEKPFVFASLRTLHLHDLFLSWLLLHFGRVFLHFAEVELRPTGVSCLFWLFALEDVGVFA